MASEATLSVFWGGAIAAFAGLSTAVIIDIVQARLSGPSGIIDGLCRAMGAC